MDGWEIMYYLCSEIKNSISFEVFTSGWNCEPVVCSASGPFEDSLWLGVGLLFFSYCIFKKAKHTLLHTHSPTFEDADEKHTWPWIYSRRKGSIQTFQFKCQGMEFKCFFFFNCCGLICEDLLWVDIHMPFLDHCPCHGEGFETS